MTRRVLATILLFVGGFAAALSWWGFAAQQTLLDPSATREAALGLLSAKPIQDKAITSLADQLLAALPQIPAGAGGSTAASQREAATVARQAATAALQDPALRHAFADSIASLQEQLIRGDSSGKGLTLDTTAVTRAVRNAVAGVDPALAAQLDTKPVTLHLDTAKLPSLKAVDQGAAPATLWAALVALLAWSMAVLVHPEPWTAVRKIGRRVVVIGALPLIFWILVPAGLRAMHLSAAEVVSPLASAYGRRLAVPAFAVLGVGAVLWIVGHFAAKTGWGTPAARATTAPAPTPPRGAATARGARNLRRRAQAEPLERVDIRA